uniref:Growth hormone secretagogue receptor type 1 n=1 Tax=Anas platyrhynchos TaxID=8839 RepID=A0A8B9ZKH6_ANAPL
MREGSAGGRGAENRTGGEPPLHLFPAPVLTGITVACVILFVIGIFGNLMTMLVVSRFRDMRTTTNFYLSSMAFSDLLIFLCMPLDLFRLWQYRPWNFGDLLCKLFQFVSESCTYSTILNITALSVERYVAICFPLRAKVIITKRKVKLVILILWAVSFVSAGPIFVLVGVEHENGTNPLSTNECRATDVFFFLPVFCLTVLYSLIGRKDKNNKQTVKMLGRYLFSKSFEAGSLEIAVISQYCNLVSFVLFYLSAAINPILYNIMSKKYRIAACRLFGLKPLPKKRLSSTKQESSRVWTEPSVTT